MNDKKVSAVMAVYNREEYLREAIDSIINQNYDNWELILVNDASTDSSHLICEDYKKRYPEKIKYINVSENGGAGNSFYTGTINASGDYITFIGSDDIQLKDKFKKCVEFLNANTNIDMFFHNYETMNENGEKTGRNLILPNDINDNNKLLNYSLRRNYMYSGLAFIRNTKDVIFDKTLRLSEDYDLFLKLVYLGYKAAFSKEVLALVRIHSSNISAGYKNSNEAVKIILSKYSTIDLQAKLEKQGISKNKINNTLGMISILKNDFKESISFFSKVDLENCLDDDYVDNLFYGATSYYKLKCYHKALASLEKVLLKVQDEPTVYNNLAVVESALKKKSELEILLKKALIIEPLYMDAKINLKNLNSNLPLSNFTSKFLRKNVVHDSNAIIG